MELFVEARDFVVLDNDQLVQLNDLLLRVPLLPFVSLKHAEQAVNTFIACIT